MAFQGHQLCPGQNQFIEEDDCLRNPVQFESVSSCRFQGGRVTRKLVTGYFLEFGLDPLVLLQLADESFSNFFAPHSA